MEGFGIQKWLDSSKYIGCYKNDKAEGIGKLRSSNGNLIHGKIFVEFLLIKL